MRLTDAYLLVRFHEVQTLRILVPEHLQIASRFQALSLLIPKVGGVTITRELHLTMK